MTTTPNNYRVEWSLTGSEDENSNRVDALVTVLSSDDRFQGVQFQYSDSSIGIVSFGSAVNPDGVLQVLHTASGEEHSEIRNDSENEPATTVIQLGVALSPRTGSANSGIRSRLYDEVESVSELITSRSNARESVSFPKWDRRATASVLLIALVLWYFLPPTFSFKITPWGVDQWGHLTRLEILRSSISSDLVVPMWMPHWYSGQDLWQYYPPLIYFAVLPFALLTGDATNGYYAAMLPLATFAAAGFVWAFRPWLGNVLSFIGAIIFALTPMGLFPFFGEGNSAWGMQQVLMPWNLGLLLRCLDEPRKKTMVLYGLSVGLMIPAHSMLSVMTLMGTGALAVGFLVTRQTNFNKTFWTALFGGLGVMVAGFWLVPGVSHFDLQEVPSLVPDKVFLWSESPVLFDRPGAMTIIAETGRVPGRYIGYLLPIAALVGLVLGARAEKTRSFTVGFGLLAVSMFVLGLGTKTPVYEFVPVGDNLLPNRAFNLSVFAMTVLVVVGIKVLIPSTNYRFIGLNGRPSRLNLAMVGTIFFLVLLAVEYKPFWVDRSPAGFIGDDIFAELVNEEGNLWSTGRYWDITPINDSRQHFTVATEGQRQSVIGWATEGTLHADEFGLTGSELAVFRPEAVVRRADIYNTEFAWIEKSNGQLVTAFERDGFNTVTENDFNVLLQKQEDTGYLMKFDREVLAIGANANLLVAIDPEVSLGSYNSLAEYPTEYLNQFRAIVITDPAFGGDISELRKFVDARLAQNQHVVLDLTTPGAADVAGVGERSIEITGFPVATDAQGNQLNTGPFDPDGIPYFARVPLGLDTTGYSLQVAGENVPFVGEVTTETGKLSVLPFALIFHVYNTVANEGATEIISSILEVNHGPNPAPLPRIEDSSISGGDRHLNIEFESDSEQFVLLSSTYSPHWHGSINGEPIPVYRHENMTMFKAVQGRNSVQFTYRATPIQWVSGGFSLVALVSLAVTAWTVNRVRPINGVIVLVGLKKFLVDLPQWVFDDHIDQQEQEAAGRRSGLKDE